MESKIKALKQIKGSNGDTHEANLKLSSI